MTYEARSATGAGPAHPDDDLPPVVDPFVSADPGPDRGPVPTDDAPYQPPSEQPPVDPEVVSSSPRHRRQPWPLLVVSVLLALSLGLATYLLLTTRAHEQRAHEWEAAARDTGADLAQSRTDLAAVTGERDAIAEQLSTAQERITTLADEKARLGDDREAQRQLVDYQQRISVLAGKVATALTTCIDGQVTLIGYLQDPSRYDEADLARFRTDVQRVCGAATDANTRLQRELTP